MTTGQILLVLVACLSIGFAIAGAVSRREEDSRALFGASVSFAMLTLVAGVLMVALG